jgi:single-strand DNA-binding protein
MNSILLLGRATSKVELKQTQSGKSVVSFSLAVKRPFAKDTTDFFTIVAWDKQAEILSRYVDKGSQICVRGYLTTRSWEDNNGNKRYATEVVAHEVSFCDTKRDSEGNNSPVASNSSVGASATSYNPYLNNSSNFESVELDGNLPF